MSDPKIKNDLPGQLGDTCKIESGLGVPDDLEDTLPMGQHLKRGRKPKRPSPFTRNFNQLLKEKNCSHRKAAEIACVAPSVISGWSAGATPNDLAAVLRITDALHADFQFILTGVPSDAVPLSRIQEIFEIEDKPDLSGIFMVDLKRLKIRK